MEAIIVIMSVGLSVDFVVHFGVGYIHANSSDIDYERKRVKNRHLASTTELEEHPNHSSKGLSMNRAVVNKVFSLEWSDYREVYQEHQAERVTRVTESVNRVGSAVFMAAFTTFAAGFSMTLSSLCSFRQMGQFLMTISKSKEANDLIHPVSFILQCQHLGCSPLSSSYHCVRSSVQLVVVVRSHSLASVNTSDDVLLEAESSIVFLHQI